VPGGAGALQPTAAGILDAALAEAMQSGSRVRGEPRRPERAEAVVRAGADDLGIAGMLDPDALAVGGDDQGGMGAVREGQALGVMYEAETDSEFDEAEWGPPGAGAGDLYDELESLDPTQRMDDIRSVRSALARRRAAVEGRALQVGADPAAARALVQAGTDPAVTAPTSGRRRKNSVVQQARRLSPTTPVEAPIAGTMGRRRMSLEVSVPRLALDPLPDPSSLPLTLPEAPDGMDWQWVPETHTALPRPAGWNAAKGWGGFLGMRVLSAAVTPEDPLVLNERDPVVRGEAHTTLAMREAYVRRAGAEAAGGGESDGGGGGGEGEGAGLRLTEQTIDGKRVSVIREEDVDADGPDSSPDVPDDDDAAPTVTAADPSEHFLRVGLTYKAYVGAFTCETIDATEPQELAKFFLTLVLKRFLPPAETAAQEEGDSGSSFEAVTGKAPAEGQSGWTQAQLSAAMDASAEGRDPVAAAEAVRRAGGDSSGTAVPAIGFRFDAFPHVDNPGFEIEPSLHDQWGYELVPGRVYGFGAIASVPWSPMGEDDPSHRMNGGMRLAVSFTMDTEANILHEVVFRAPASMWDEAWSAHGERMMDDVCVNWRDDSTQKFA